MGRWTFGLPLTVTGTDSEEKARQFVALALSDLAEGIDLFSVPVPEGVDFEWPLVNALRLVRPQDLLPFKGPTADEVRKAGMEPCCEEPRIIEAQHGWVYHEYNPLSGEYEMNTDGDPETTGYKCESCGHGWEDRDHIFRPGHEPEEVEGL